MVGGESKGPWAGGGTAPPIPTVPELEQLREDVRELRAELARAREAERRLHVRCRRAELAASRAASVLRALAPVLSCAVHALAAATLQSQADAADDAGELPF
ncbi:MAG: hypothetical protein KIT58_00025 [Planctomycetota bacterium]|nr:hypothetical protein [Planctomycetota bacterium]